MGKRSEIQSESPGPGPLLGLPQPLGHLLPPAHPRNKPEAARRGQAASSRTASLQNLGLCPLVFASDPSEGGSRWMHLLY